MDQNQPLKKRMVDTLTIQGHASPQYYQYVSMSNDTLQQNSMQQQQQQQLQLQLQHQHHHHQQQLQNQHQLNQQQQQHTQHQQKPTHKQQPERNQPQQPTTVQYIPQLVQYDYVERPMSLNAWTQTRSEDFPGLSHPSYYRNETFLLAKIKELEECLRAQTEFINQLKEQSFRTPSPPQNIPNSTTITPTGVKHEGTRYRILAQADEAINEAQFSIELSDRGLPHNLSSSTDSDRLEIYLSDENSSSPRTPPKPIVSKNIPSNLERPDLENAKVSIGPNGTKIPVNEYEKMTWTSPSLATRKLLTLIFDRETLATHSMTGKASPAFKDLDKPIKGKLDPDVVQDIIFIVSKKCSVSPKEVRAAITTKCADENKMVKLQAIKRTGIHDSKRPALMELNRMKSGDFCEENT